jgi:hypothetical protein
MTMKPDFGLQPKNLSLFQGLIENEGRSYSNWGLHRSTRPAVYAEPITYADVQSLVHDGARLRVQAGCRLKKLNSWLQSRRLEIPFQAEIGEASVGSVAAGDTKESSLGGPGYFSAHVTALTYVGENGGLRALSDLKDGAAFHEFKCCFGLSGIIVECCVENSPGDAVPVRHFGGDFCNTGRTFSSLADQAFPMRRLAGARLFASARGLLRPASRLVPARLRRQNRSPSAMNFVSPSVWRSSMGSMASNFRNPRDLSIHGPTSSTNIGAQRRANGGSISNILSTMFCSSNMSSSRPTPSPNRFRKGQDMFPAALPPISCSVLRKRKNPSGSIPAVPEFPFPSTPSAQTQRSLCGSSSRANTTNLQSISWGPTPRRSRPNG